MIIRLAELSFSEKTRIEVSGKEEWLSPVYNEFFSRNGGSRQQQLLTAQVTLEKISDSACRVSASIQFNTVIECSTCRQPVAWNINESFERVFNCGKKLGAVVDLKAEDMDEEVIYEDHIDIAQLIHETLVLAIPSQTVSACEQCSNDRDDRANRLVYSGEANMERKNSFHKLKDFKTN